MKEGTHKTKKIVSKKNVPEYTHTTDEVLEYIKEVSTDFDKKITVHIGALSEDFQHRVSAIAEQFSGLHEKLDEHGRILNEHGRILNEHGRILNEHGRILNEHGGILNSHTEMIGRLMIDVEEIKVSMRSKVGRDEFDKLESRLVSLESFVFSNQGKIAQKTKK